MGGRWKNFNFKIVGSRFFFLATVARLRVEFSALLHGQGKIIQMVFLHAQRINTIGVFLENRDNRRKKI
jgi:hypothetical protein